VVFSFFVASAMIRFAHEYRQSAILQQPAAKLQSIENFIQFVLETVGLERVFIQPSLHLTRFTIRLHLRGPLGQRSLPIWAFMITSHLRPFVTV
jgi:hypothetical protein